MKKIKTTILKVSLIVLGLQPTVSIAQWSIPGNIGSSWISTYGNVGIGTTSPQYGKLHIYGEGNPLAGGPEYNLHPFYIQGTAASNPQVLFMGVNAASQFSYIQAAQFGIAKNKLALNPGGGNVVVGSNLFVSSIGSQLGLDNPASFTYGSNTFGTYSLGWVNDTWQGSPTAYLSSFGGIKFFTQNLTRFSINQAGNIGISGAVSIGANAPTGKTPVIDYMLSVKGTIYSTEVNVIPVWADYVFKSDYKLPSLTEVEKYIKEKGHLKDVPSADEVAKNGVKLGEMDATLLRKVEELTLYMLAQEKKNIEQQKEIEELKAQIKK